MQKVNLILVLTLLTTILQAATFDVSTTAEFRQSLLDAAQNGEDDTINLADGTYKTTDDGQGTFKFLDNESYSLTLVGSSADNVILSGDNQHQIFNHNATVNPPLIITNLSFINGKSIDDNGGAINSVGNITVNECKFTNNLSYFIGGGIITTKKAFINKSTFRDNISGKPGNVSSGGALYAVLEVTVTNSIFTNNKADKGGGINGRKSVEVNNSKFENNIGHGGGFYARSYVIVNNSEFINNTANIYGDSKGGGFFAGWSNSENPTIVVNSIFKDNKSNWVGAGFYSSSSTTKVINSIFINNIITRNDNEHARGGGLYTNGPTLIVNSLFTKNSDAIGSEATVCNSSFFNNNIDINTRNDAIMMLNNNYLNLNNFSGSYFGENNIYNGVNTEFVDESTENYRLTLSSDLIDKGITNIPNCQDIPLTDMDGNIRISGFEIDIGPYEYQLTPPSIPTNINATDGTLEQIIGVTWLEVDSTTHYNVYRSKSKDIMGDIVGITVSTSLTDDTVEVDTQYYYRVKACNDNGCSDYSEPDGGYIGTVNEWYKVQPAITNYLLN